MRIYLAGDLESDWRSTFHLNRESTHTFLDPLEHYHIKQEDAYTRLDLLQVEMADIVLAYFAADGGRRDGTNFELGYAKGLGKLILIVDEQPEEQHFGMARSQADVVVHSLEEAIDFLDALPC